MKVISNARVFVLSSLNDNVVTSLGEGALYITVQVEDEKFEDVLHPRDGAIVLALVEDLLGDLFTTQNRRELISFLDPNGVHQLC